MLVDFSCIRFHSSIRLLLFILILLVYYLFTFKRFIIYSYTFVYIILDISNSRLRYSLFIRLPSFVNIISLIHIHSFIRLHFFFFFVFVYSWSFIRIRSFIFVYSFQSFKKKWFQLYFFCNLITECIFHDLCDPNKHKHNTINTTQIN